MASGGGIRETTSGAIETSTQVLTEFRSGLFRSWTSFINAGRFKVVAILVAAAGMAAVYLAVLYSGIWLGAIGMFLIAVGIYPVRDAVVAEVKKPGASLLRWLAISLALLVAAGVLILFGLAREWSPIVFAGVLAGIIGLLPLTSVLRLQSGDKRQGSDQGWGPLITVLGLAILVAGIVAAASVSWLLGAVLILGGVTAYRTGLTGFITQDRFARSAWIGLVGLVVGTAIVIVSAESSSLMLFVIGAFPGTLAAHLLSVSLSSDAGQSWKDTNDVWLRLRRPAHWVVGIVLLITWILIVTVYDQPFAVGTAMALFVAGVGALFVWRGESMLIILLFGFLIAWGAIDRDVDPTPDWNTDNGRILALGDSYISGEGAPLYLEGTNTKGPDRNECRRAPTAYPMVVAEELEMDIQFLSCSGAKAVDILYRAQMPESPDDVPGAAAQIDQADWEAPFDFVLLSIGGNDANFSDVVIGCLLPGSCADVGTNFMLRAHDPIPGLELEHDHRDAPPNETAAEKEQRLIGEAFDEKPMGDKMLELFETVRDRAGPDTPVIVMPYPLMVTPTGCRYVMLTTEEHQFVTRFVELLNAQAAKAAARAGVHFFEGGRTAFVDDRLCSNDEVEPAAINFISLLPVEGSLVDRVNPANWPHQSMHPNSTGHGRTAAALLAWLATDPPTSNPAPKPGVSFEDENIPINRLTPDEITKLQEGENAGIDAEAEWRNYVLSQAAKTAWPIITILLLGGLLFALTSVHEPFSRPELQSSETP